MLVYFGLTLVCKGGLASKEENTLRNVGVSAKMDCTISVPVEILVVPII